MAQHFMDRYTAFELADLVKTGELSATEICDDAFDTIAERDSDIKAFLELTPELARNAAQCIDERRARGEELGALAGVPVAFKDNMHLRSTKTTCASKMLEHYTSTFDATCVRQMLDADGICLGKLNMDEFAFGSSTETSYFQRTHNPHDLACVPGGSSGGSAAAVAAGIASITLGSDTGGSIRQPGAFCGVAAFKPTYGMISRYGVVAFASSLDQVGPFGRSIKDIALAMNVLTGKDPRDCTSQPCNTNFLEGLDSFEVTGKRIGIVPAMLEAKGVTPEVRDALHEAYTKLEARGARLVEIELPHSEAAMSAYYVIGPSEAFSNLSRFDSVRYGHRADAPNLAHQTSQSRYEGFGPEVRRRIMLGAYLLSSGVYETYYYPAQKVRTLITQDFNQAFEQVDTLLIPTSPRAAFEFGAVSDPTEMYLSDMFTVANNIAGNCAINVPLGMGHTSGLPVGAQLIGASFEDHTLLKFAAALEREYPAVETAYTHHMRIEKEA